MKLRWELGIFIGLFILSRLYVLMNPPYYAVTKPDGTTVYEGYSDVKHDSERYANMWYYGMTPYREHLFEYPPAAIPIMYIPLLIDQAHIGHYYLNYRVQIFLLESILFGAILYTLYRLPISRQHRWLSGLFYLGIGALAKDFWYDGLDLVFFGSFMLAIMWRLFRDHDRLINASVFWAFFWLSVAIKLLTIPLLVPLLFLRIRRWRKEILACFLGGVIVWGIPLLLYRSSLSVFLFFHGTRPIKYESFPAAIVRAINDFTQSEVQSNILPHLPVLGPVSKAMERIVGVMFPLAMMLILIWGVWMIVARLKSRAHLTSFYVFQLSLKIVLVYLFGLFLSSKILSRPFHMWYAVPIALYPFKNRRWQLTFFLLAMLMIALDTTPYLPFPKGSIGPLALDRLRDGLRFTPMAILLVSSVKLPIHPGKMRS